MNSPSGATLNSQCQPQCQRFREHVEIYWKRGRKTDSWSAWKASSTGVCSSRCQPAAEPPRFPGPAKGNERERGAGRAPEEPQPGTAAPASVYTARTPAPPRQVSIRGLEYTGISESWVFTAGLLVLLNNYCPGAVLLCL